MRFAKISFLSLVLMAIGFVGNAEATDTNAALTVTATAKSACVLQAATLAFGDYVSNSAIDVDANVDMTITCVGSGSYMVWAEGTREMTTGAGGAGNVLTYQLYGSAALRTSGTALPSAVGDKTIAYTTATTEIPIFGRIAKEQAVNAGSYTGTIQIHVEY